MELENEDNNHVLDVDKPKKPSIYLCEICRTICQSEELLKAHSKQETHLMKLRNNKDMHKFCTDCKLNYYYDIINKCMEPHQKCLSHKWVQAINTFGSHKVIAIKFELKHGAINFLESRPELLGIDYIIKSMYKDTSYYLCYLCGFSPKYFNRNKLHSKPKAQKKAIMHHILSKEHVHNFIRVQTPTLLNDFEKFYSEEVEKQISLKGHSSKVDQQIIMDAVIQKILHLLPNHLQKSKRIRYIEVNPKHPEFDMICHIMKIYNDISKEKSKFDASYENVSDSEHIEQKETENRNINKLASSLSRYILRPSDKKKELTRCISPVAKDKRKRSKNYPNLKMTKSNDIITSEDVVVEKMDNHFSIEKDSVTNKTIIRIHKTPSQKLSHESTEITIDNKIQDSDDFGDKLTSGSSKTDLIPNEPVAGEDSKPRILDNEVITKGDYVILDAFSVDFDEISIGHGINVEDKSNVGEEPDLNKNKAVKIDDPNIPKSVNLDIVDSRSTRIIETGGSQGPKNFRIIFPPKVKEIDKLDSGKLTDTRDSKHHHNRDKGKSNSDTKLAGSRIRSGSRSISSDYMKPAPRGRKRGSRNQNKFLPRNNTKHTLPSFNSLLRKKALQNNMLESIGSFPMFQNILVTLDNQTSLNEVFGRVRGLLPGMPQVDMTQEDFTKPETIRRLFDVLGNALNTIFKAWACNQNIAHRLEPSLREEMGADQNSVCILLKDGIEAEFYDTNKVDNVRMNKFLGRLNQLLARMSLAEQNSRINLERPPYLASSTTYPLVAGGMGGMVGGPQDTSYDRKRENLERSLTPIWSSDYKNALRKASAKLADDFVNSAYSSGRARSRSKSSRDRERSSVGRHRSTSRSRRSTKRNRSRESLNAGSKRLNVIKPEPFNFQTHLGIQSRNTLEESMRQQEELAHSLRGMIDNLTAQTAASSKVSMLEDKIKRLIDVQNGLLLFPPPQASPIDSFDTRRNRSDPSLPTALYLQSQLNDLINDQENAGFLARPGNENLKRLLQDALKSQVRILEKYQRENASGSNVSNIGDQRYDSLPRSSLPPPIDERYRVDRRRPPGLGGNPFEPVRYDQNNQPFDHINVRPPIDPYHHLPVPRYPPPIQPPSHDFRYPPPPLAHNPFQPVPPPYTHPYPDEHAYPTLVRHPLPPHNPTPPHHAPPLPYRPTSYVPRPPPSHQNIPQKPPVLEKLKYPKKKSDDPTKLSFLSKLKNHNLGVLSSASDVGLSKSSLIQVGTFLRDNQEYGSSFSNLSSLSENRDEYSTHRRPESFSEERRFNVNSSSKMSNNLTSYYTENHPRHTQPPQAKRMDNVRNRNANEYRTGHGTFNRYFK
ncbi:unnamed protein product [Gordionus sp. m RMFG-2023]|uniref:uncharacterized protein LOC135931482 n=1 Tax=Gordionus sp. m RMFG-2023 TaxID=3053472 RepID=UPI0030DDFE9B